jgi:uncharacterized membrane protein YfcA
MSIALWVLALAVTAGAATIQGTVGLGFAMVSVPLLSLIDTGLAPVPQLIVALPLTMSIAWRERHSIDLRGFWWIIGGRIPGAFIGIALLAVATQKTLDVFIGVVVLIAVAVLATGVHIRRTRSTKFATGVASGTTGVVASIGGPAIALLYSSAEAKTIRPTIAAVFTIGLSLSLVFRAASGNVTGSDFAVSAVLFPAVVGGYLVSSSIKDRIPTPQVRIAILVISSAAAIGLLVRALLT